MAAVNDVIHSFRLIVDGKAGGVVAAVSHSRHYEGAVRLAAVDEHRSHIGNGLSVEFALVRSLEGSRRSRLKVVPQSGLVIYYCNCSLVAFQEAVLGGGVGISLHGADVKRLSVRGALYLVKGSLVLGIQKSGSTVSGDARGAV